MKGAREVKAESARQNQHKGGSRASETGPLFPRLHVNETEKAGPRAPPRNKMALYELFTIPSHRFVPSSGVNRPAAASYSQQYVSTECRHPYVSYYTPPIVSQANANVGAPTHTHLSLGASNGSAVVDEDESQRVPGSQVAEKTGPCDVVSKSMATSRTNNPRNVIEKKTEYNDFRVPTLSSHRVQSKQSNRPVGGVSVGNGRKLCSSSSSGTAQSGVVASVPSAGDRPQDLKLGLESSLSENQRCPSVKSAEVKEKGLFIVADEQPPGQVVQRSADKLPEQPSEDQSTISPGHSCQQSASSDMGQLPKSDSVCQAGPSTVRNSEDLGLPNQHAGVGECTSTTSDDPIKVKAISCDSGPSKASLALVEDKDYEGSSREDRETSSAHRDDPDFADGQRACPQILGETAEAEGVDLSKDHNSAKDKYNSSGESENLSNSDGVVSESAQDCDSDDSDSSMLDLVSAPSIAPKDVIRTVGQQQFWRARRAILRQQRIFSDQVFELHKLIKVQQLLAETPNVLIGEDIGFGAAPVAPECDTAACHGDNTLQDTSVAREVQNPVSALNAVGTNQSTSAVAQPEFTPCYPGWSPVVNNHSNGQMCVGPYPSMPVAWGYPSVGMGQWMGPPAAQAGVFFYQPSVGSFPPVSGGSYGSAVMGQGAPSRPSPMVSFGSSNYDQKPELKSEMHSRHGPTGSSNPLSSSPVCHNSAVGPMPADYPGTWYAMPHNYASCNQRSLGVSGEDAPSHLVASITNQPEVSLHRAVMPCVPGIPFQWGINGQSGKIGMKGGRPEYEAEEQSQSVDAGSNANALPSTGSVAFCQKSDCRPHDEHRWAQSLHLACAYRSADVDNCDDDANYVGDKEGGNKSARRSKRKKETGTELVGVGSSDEDTGAVHSPNQSLNALALFPLGPSLNPMDHGRQKSGGTDECQGRVIKVVPRAAIAASESAADILLSIQQERRQ